MRRMAIMLALALVGCGDGGGGGGGNVVVVAPAVPPTVAGWQWQASANVGGNPGSVESFTFTFPVGQDGAHYLVKPWGGPIAGLTLDYAIETTGSPTFVALDKGQPEPSTAMVTLYFQKSGDTGFDPAGRWWAAGIRGPLAAGSYTIAAMISDADKWSGVNGQRDATQLNAAAASVGTVGFTFGGMFFGHGVYVTGGTATMIMKKFTVN